MIARECVGGCEMVREKVGSIVVDHEVSPFSYEDLLSHLLIDYT